MAYTTINKSTDNFNTKLYTGNGSAGRSITGVGFQPDFTWIKSRTGTQETQSHILSDAVRGAGKYLFSDSDDAEGTDTNRLTSFDADGFTVGSNNSVNASSTTYASWNWKAATTSIPSGSTTDPSAVRINATAGFGIYKITAPSSGNYVLKHGLGATPKMVIVKRTNGQQKWMTWHHTFSNLTDNYLQLNDSAAKATYSTCWGTMNSTDCTIATGGTLDTGGEHVIYVFTEITGYSKFGTYTGNGNVNGTFAYTGFKPTFLIYKRTDNTGYWRLHDTKRDPHNVAYHNIFPNRAEAEGTTDSGTGYNIDILSNGFKMRTTLASSNDSGGTWIYMAFGQSLVGSNNIPCTAR